MQDGGLGECYMPLADVAQQLLSWGLPQHYPHVYVASQGFSQAKAEELLSVGGLTSVTAGTASCLRESSGGVECSGFDPVSLIEGRAWSSGLLAPTCAGQPCQFLGSTAA